MADIKETRELLVWALDTALEAKEIWANGKFGFEDIDNVFRVLRGAPAAFKGADQVVQEFWDYDEAEQKVICDIVAGRLAPWGLNEVEIKAMAEVILNAIIANARVARFFVNLKRDRKTKANEPKG